MSSSTSAGKCAQSSHRALRKLSGGDGLKINIWVVPVNWSLLAKEGREVPVQGLQTSVLDLSGAYCIMRTMPRKNGQCFWKGAGLSHWWHNPDYHTASLTKVKPESTWTLPPKVKPEPTLSSPERWELSSPSHRQVDLRTWTGWQNQPVAQNLIYVEAGITHKQGQLYSTM